MPATAGGRIITKMLTDLTTSGIAAAPSATGSGEMKKIAFVPDSTCAEVYLWWQNTASTGSTKIDSLFYDQLLISSNKFLQVESQIKNEVVQVYPADANSSTQWGSTNTAIIQFPSTGDVYNTTGNLVTFASTVADGCSITANKECIINGFLVMQPTGTGEIFGWSLNSTELTTNIQNITAAHILAMTSTTVAIRTTVPVTVRMSVGDVLRPHGGNIPSTFTYTVGRLSLDIKPVDQEKVIIESEDEIFTSWVEYTPTTGTGFGTISNLKAWWRRVGDSMQIRGAYTSGTVAAADAYLTIPSGYNIDTAKVTNLGLGDVGYAYRVSTGVASFDSGNTFELWVDGTTSDKVYMNKASASTTSYGKMQPGTAISTGDSMTFHGEFPIVGWKSKFTPLLSMPLVDFGSYSNIYSAKISASATLTSESESFIASVSNSTAGVCVITFNSGHFSQAPAISAAGDTNSTTNELIVSVDALSASACTIRTSLDSGVETDGDFWLMFQRQGADFKQPPQPTAAIIKPSVAFVKEVQAYNVDGGVAVADAWTPRTLNTIEGESWFINSLSSNIVTVQPGQYEIEATAPLSRIDGFLISLYDTTNTVRLAWSECMTSPDSKNHNVMVKWAGTFTAATGVRLEYMADTASTDAQALGFPPASVSTAITSADRAIYSQMKITKLK